MNVSTYIFGNFKEYTQYPNDYTKSIFQTFLKNANSSTQLAIHRDDNLMYYSYIRKTDNNQLFGICFVINSLMIININELIDYFENTFSNLIAKGNLVQFNEKGDVITEIIDLNEKKHEIQTIIESLRNGFQRLNNYTVTLPAVNNAIPKNTIKKLSLDDKIDDIIFASHSYSYTLVPKGNDIDTNQTNSYRQILKKINKEKEELANQKEKIKKDYDKLKNQQKQYKYVALLVIVVVFCLYKLEYSNSNLQNARILIDELKKDTIRQNNMLRQKDTVLQNTNNMYWQLDSEYKKTKNSLDSIKNKLGTINSFIILNSSFNFTTGYFSFNYYSANNTSKRLHFKIYDDNGYLNNTNEIINIQEGYSSQRIYISYFLNSNNAYTIEIWDGNKIIGGGVY